MIINNNITNDTYTERAERIQLLSTNIDDFAVELGIAGDRLTACQDADTQWEDASAKGVVEDGQMDEAYETFHQSVKAAAEYYQMAKDHLLTIIYEAEGAPDDFINAYGFDVDSPRRYKKLTAAIEAWKRNHDFLIGKNDPRVVTDAIMTNLLTHKTTIDGLSNVAFIEKEEADTAFDEKQALYDVQTRLLQFVFSAAILTWGNDDPKLNLLGFKPKSEVWTENKPPHPTDFAHDGMQFTWDVVEGVDNYEIDYRLTGASGDWTQLYMGAENFTTKKPPDPGEYDFRIRSWADDDSGAWSGVILVNFSGGALVGVPVNFKFDDVKQLFTWDFMELALLYELEISRDEGQTWMQKYFDVDTYFNAGHLDTGAALARVRALDGYQEPGEWTAPLAVTFILLAPAFLAYSQYKNEFVCNWVPLATGYEFEILDDPSATWEPLYNGPNNHFVHDLKFGDWKIRVRAWRGQDFSVWTPAIVVNIIFKPPAGLLYDPSALKIKWDKVPDAAQYQLVNESGTTSYIGADNQLDIELLAPEKFRVRAGDDTMLVWGEWSDWKMLG